VYYKYFLAAAPSAAIQVFQPLISPPHGGFVSSSKMPDPPFVGSGIP
jgi:hypothetical protein